MMKVGQAVHYYLQYHKANSQRNTVRSVGFTLREFDSKFQDRDISSVSKVEVLSFLNKLTFNRKQTTKRNRYSVLSSFYNFTINTSSPTQVNPCSNSITKKTFRNPPQGQTRILDKDTVDEIIFRRMSGRNRIMLELMARAGDTVNDTIAQGRFTFLSERLFLYLFEANKLVLQWRLPLPRLMSRSICQHDLLPDYPPSMTSGFDEKIPVAGFNYLEIHARRVISNSPKAQR